MTGRAAHIGHRMIVRTADLLWCTDCAQSVSLAVESYQPPRYTDPRCPHHQWEHAGACRACRAEQLADEHRTRPPAPSTEQGRAAARALATAALAAREETR